MNSFVDSGGWLALVIATDRYHSEARAHFGHLQQARARLVTTDYVLDEVVTRLRYDAGHASAVRFLDLAHDAQAGGVLALRYITQEQWSRAKAIFLKYPDVKLSFTDRTSFAVLEEESVDEVFGFDSHCAIMGHRLAPQSATR